MESDAKMITKLSKDEGIKNQKPSLASNHKCQIKLPINEAFKTQLITGILTSPIVYIPNHHYNYVDSALEEIAKCRVGINREMIYELDMSKGHVDFATKLFIDSEGFGPLDVLGNLLAPQSDKQDGQSVQRSRVFLMKGLAKAHDSQALNHLNDPELQLRLQTFAEKYERGDYDPRTTIILASPVPVSQLPKELIDIISVIEIPAPTIDEIETCVRTFKVSEQFKIKEESLVTDLCRTLQGLSFYDIQQILRSVLVRTGNRLTENTKTLALEEKKRIVKKSGIIEVIDSDVSFNDVGGLEVLCADMRKKAVVFKHLSRATDNDVRLPIPKGILIVGMPGCGKSLIAKSIAKEFGVSLLRLDISNLMGQYVGQSEENLRKALATAEAAHPCVLWIDEIEKAFHGANSSNSNENDTLVMRMMGYFLTWMQERKTAVYIVATANDVMRPEFMRKGRFDEVYFVDFPKQKEREEIFRKKIHHFNNSEEHESIFDFTDVIANLEEVAKEAVAEKTVEGKEGGFSGSEIDCVVNTVVENKFADYAKKALDEQESYPLPIKITKDDFIKVINEMKPHVMSGQITRKKEKDKKQKTSIIDFHPSTQIENIYKMQETYQFKPASKNGNTDNTVSE